MGRVGTMGVVLAAVFGNFNKAVTGSSLRVGPIREKWKGPTLSRIRAKKLKA
jgi:hypothetical protein